jgi:hypothetical protein
VENKKQYIDRLGLTIEHLHNCSASHAKTQYVKEVFQGETAWEGDVEIFSLSGHPKAHWCYGWSYGEPEQFITILDLPPVDSPQSAVKVGVAYQIKKGKT